MAESINQKVVNYIVSSIKNVICIYIGGSYLTNTIDDESDRDIMVITKGVSKEQLQVIYPSQYWSSFFFKPIESFYALEQLNLSIDLYPVHLSSLQREDLVYEAEGAKEILDKLFENKEVISHKACKLLLAQNRNKIEKTVKDFKFEKVFYHFIYAYGILTKTQIDKQLLIDIKRGRNNAACLEYLNKIHEFLIS